MVFIKQGLYCSSVMQGLQLHCSNGHKIEISRTPNCFFICRNLRFIMYYWGDFSFPRLYSKINKRIIVIFIVNWRSFGRMIGIKQMLQVLCSGLNKRPSYQIDRSSFLFWSYFQACCGLFGVAVLVSASSEPIANPCSVKLRLFPLIHTL